MGLKCASPPFSRHLLSPLNKLLLLFSFLEHPLSRGIKTFLNLEGAGSGG